MAKITDSAIARAQRSMGFAELPVALLPLTVFIPVAFLGTNTLLALYACSVLSIGLALLWRPQEPPILLFLFLYQWVQATVGTFYGNLLGIPVGNLAENAGQHEEAIALILTGLIVLAMAMRVAAGRVRPELTGLLRTFVSAYPARTWVAIYITAWLFSTACGIIAPLSGGLRQVFLIFAEVKWAAFLFLTASTFGVSERSTMPWLIVFAVELALSVGGFFADFRSVFLYSLIGIAVSGQELLKRNKAIVAMLVVAMLTFAVAWSAVKEDYRVYLNGGSREQVVLVGYEDRLANLVDRVAGLNAAGMAYGADRLVSRLSYYEYFGVVLQRAASGQPHSGGEIWSRAVLSPLMPRLFFPDKLQANDTTLTLRYTGIYQPAWRQGTSISLGYMTEAFIDFGLYGMFVAVAMLGLLIGFIYRWLLRQTGWRLLAGASFVPIALMPALMLETSIVKLIPALIISILGGIVLLKFLAPMLLRWAGVIRRRPVGVHLANKRG